MNNKVVLDIMRQCKMIFILSAEGAAFHLHRLVLHRVISYRSLYRCQMMNLIYYSSCSTHSSSYDSFSFSGLFNRKSLAVERDGIKQKIAFEPSVFCWDIFHFGWLLSLKCSELIDIILIASGTGRSHSNAQELVHFRRGSGKKKKNNSDSNFQR